jgi:hypothetical protein
MGFRSEDFERFPFYSRRVNSVDVDSKSVLTVNVKDHSVSTQSAHGKIS